MKYPQAICRKREHLMHACKQPFNKAAARAELEQFDSTQLYTSQEVAVLIVQFVNELGWRNLWRVLWCKVRGRRWIQ